MFEKLLSFVKKEENKVEEFNSEALKKGIQPSKSVEEMTEEEIKEFLSTLNPDDMGFLGREGADDGDK